MGDLRAELAALVAAYDKHRKWTLNAVFEGLHQAVEHARDVLAAEPQIEAPGWCETDAEQYAWQAGWEARDDAMLQPSLPVARLSENAQVIEPANHTIMVPVPAPIPVSERLPGPEDCAAARAIVKAFDERYELHTFEEDWQEQCLAAALRELASRINGADHIRADILSIVNELEGW